MVERYYFILVYSISGPPVFVNSNHEIHFGTEGYHMNLNVHVYSLSNITCSILSNLYLQQTSYTVQIRSISTRAFLLGKNIRLHGYQVLFTFQKLTKLHFQTYMVTVCNMYGNNSFHGELKRKGMQFQNFCLFHYNIFR